jgi:hypothetical protein
MTCVFCLIWTLSLSAADKPRPYTPKNGFVPDESTAIAIAEAVLTPIYGRETVESERPYHVKLEAGVWLVGGSLPEGRVGGVAVIKISRKDGRILFVSHGK